MITSRKTVRKLKEYEVKNPTSYEEAIEITKNITCMMFSEIIVERKVFEKVNYTDYKFCDTKIKFIDLEYDHVLEFSNRLKIAMDLLLTRQLKSLSIQIQSNGSIVEEYSVNYSYDNDTVLMHFSEDSYVKVVSGGPLEDCKIKASVEDILKKLKHFMENLTNLPEDRALRIHLNAACKVNSKYYYESSREKHGILSAKAKFGKLKTKFNSATFSAKSSLLEQGSSHE